MSKYFEGGASGEHRSELKQFIRDQKGALTTVLVIIVQVLLAPLATRHLPSVLAPARVTRHRLHLSGLRHRPTAIRSRVGERDHTCSLFATGGNHHDANPLPSTPRGAKVSPTLTPSGRIPQASSAPDGNERPNAGIVPFPTYVAVPMKVAVSAVAVQGATQTSHISAISEQINAKH